MEKTMLRRVMVGLTILVIALGVANVVRANVSSKWKRSFKSSVRLPRFQSKFCNEKYACWVKKDDCIADRGIASVNGSKVELRYRDCAYGKEETWKDILVL